MMEKSGIEQARMFIGSGRPPGIAEALDFELLAVEEGFAACGGLLGEHALNPLGYIHGGYIATLLDTACGFAVMSKLESKQSYTTIELKTAYHKGLTLKNGHVRAEGRVISMGKRVAFAEARILDGNDIIYASATSSLLIMSG